MDKKKLLRAIDANFNRAKEGLRVVEDSLRFIYENDSLRKKTRKLRHSLDLIAQNKHYIASIKLRDSNADLGKNVDSLELSRTDCQDVLYANLQRVKESLRALEEFFKIIQPSLVAEFKNMRYLAYTLEKNILLKYPPKKSKTND